MTRGEELAARRDKVERCVSGGLPASGWARLNHVNRTSLYRWLEWFRDHEPEVLGGRELARAGDGHRDWYERVGRAAHGPPAGTLDGRPTKVPGRRWGRVAVETAPSDSVANRAVGRPAPTGAQNSEVGAQMRPWRAAR